mgnify:CR=1 FL=1
METNLTEVYLDNSATTRCSERAKDLMVKVLMEDYGNPSSLHMKGVEAENYIKEAKKKIAKTLKVDEKEILFTSGGTESNNTALIGAALANKRAGNHIITTSIEHASVSAVTGYLEELGFRVTYLKVDADGIISLDELREAVCEDTILVSMMMVNNEIAPFNNADFRRAIASAIDKEAVIQVSLQGTGSVSDSMLPGCFNGVTDTGAMTYDVEKAKEYFAASGLDPADCGFAIICSDDMKLRQGQVIQSCLKENLGIETTLESMDLATYLDVTATGDYQAAIGNYTASSVLAFSQGVYHSMSINGSNKTRLNNPEIDALIEKVQATLDPEENEKAVTELSDAINELCPQAPLFVRNNIRAYKKGLKGFNINAAGSTYYHKMSWE